MRVIALVCITFIGFVITGCTKSISLKTDKNRPLYAIEGRISTMKGPYLVRVTRIADLSAATTPPADSVAILDNAEPVLDAQVIIWDEAGDMDTLQPVQNIEPPRYEYTYLGNGKLDSAFLSLTPVHSRDRGYYRTTHLTGLAGHTYHLKVRIGSEEFQASAYMPPVPALDSVVIKQIIDERNGSAISLPFAYFKEPQNEKNYYLLQYNYITDYPYDYSYGRIGTGKVFPYYVVDDSALPSYVNGLPVRVIISDHYNYGDDYPYMTATFAAYNAIQVRLSSLTKEAYNYYRQLEKQFQDDGNVYKPAPSSPVGNISNGAVGLFYASAVSYKLHLPD